MTVTQVKSFGSDSPLEMHYLLPEDPKRVLLVLHGNEGNSRELLAYGRLLDKNEECLVAAPTGLMDTGNGNASWFDLANPDYVGGISTAVISTNDALESLCSEFDLDVADTVLVGFSQGAFVALSYAFSAPPHGRDFAGVISLSGAMPPAEEVAHYDWARTQQMPVLAQHGTDDDVIGIAYGKEVPKVLRQQGIEVTFVEYAGGHQPTVASLGYAASWVTSLCDGTLGKGIDVKIGQSKGKATGHIMEL